LEIADDWILHDNNAPAHTALSIREFLTKNCIPLLPQVPHSQGLSLCDILLVPKIKIKGYHLGTFGSVQKAVTDAIKTLRNGFEFCYEAWKIFWAKYVAEGCYFEGGGVVDLDK
jgi:hypothetical protein